MRFIDYLILALAWMMYFALHSLLASERAKTLFAKFFHLKSVGYRILYNAVFALGLAALLFWDDKISTYYFFERNDITRYLSLLLSTSGVLILKAAFKQYSIKGFLGLKTEDNKFSRDGILSKVRHPIYSATILIILGFFIFNPDVPTLIMVICTLIYLPIGIYSEEKKLLAKYGKEYEEYRRAVPSIFPRI